MFQRILTVTFLIAATLAFTGVSSCSSQKADLCEQGRDLKEMLQASAQTISYTSKLALTQPIIFSTDELKATCPWMTEGVVPSLSRTANLGTNLANNVFAETEEKCVREKIESRCEGNRRFNNTDRCTQVHVCLEKVTVIKKDSNGNKVTFDGYEDALKMSASAMKARRYILVACQNFDLNPAVAAQALEDAAKVIEKDVDTAGNAVYAKAGCAETEEKQ